MIMTQKSIKNLIKGAWYTQLKWFNSNVFLCVCTCTYVCVCIQTDTNTYGKEVKGEREGEGRKKKREENKGGKIPKSDESV